MCGLDDLCLSYLSTLVPSAINGDNFFFVSFFKKLINYFTLCIVLVLTHIDLNPPWVYMCSPSWTPRPPPSPSHPNGNNWFDCLSVWFKIEKELNADELGRYLIHINDTIRKTVGKKLTLFSLESYFQSRSVTLNEHQALAINEYELAKLERNRNKVRGITVW